MFDSPEFKVGDKVVITEPNYARLLFACTATVAEPEKFGMVTVTLDGKGSSTYLFYAKELRKING